MRMRDLMGSRSKKQLDLHTGGADAGTPKT